MRRSSAGLTSKARPTSRTLCQMNTRMSPSPWTPRRRLLRPKNSGARLTAQRARRLTQQKRRRSRPRRRPVLRQQRRHPPRRRSARPTRPATTQVVRAGAVFIAKAWTALAPTGRRGAQPRPRRSSIARPSQSLPSAAGQTRSDRQGWRASPTRPDGLVLFFDVTPPGREQTGPPTPSGSGSPAAACPGSNWPAVAVSGAQIEQHRRQSSWSQNQV